MPIADSIVFCGSWYILGTLGLQPNVKYLADAGRWLPKLCYSLRQAQI
jgi:hypothetical protein